MKGNQPLLLILAVCDRTFLIDVETKKSRALPTQYRPAEMSKILGKYNFWWKCNYLFVKKECVPK